MMIMIIAMIIMIVMVVILMIIMTKMTKNTSKYCDFSWHDCINVTNTFVEDMNCENLLGL